MKIKEDIKDDVKLDDVKETLKKETKTKKTPAKKAAPKKAAKKDDGDDILERLRQAYPSLDKIFVDKYGGVFTYKAPETKEYKLK